MPLHIGDIVKIKDYMGKVEEINLRDTVIRTFQGQMVIIPNKEMRIKKAYDANDITIPFPIRTLDFRIKGGMKLDDVMGK